MEMLGLTSAALRIAAAARRKPQRSEMQRIPLSQKSVTQQQRRKEKYPTFQQTDIDP